MLSFPNNSSRTYFFVVEKDLHVRGFCDSSSKSFVTNPINEGWRSSLLKTRWITCSCTLTDSFINYITFEWHSVLST